MTDEAGAYDVHSDRISYHPPRLDPDAFPPTPVTQFAAWLQYAAEQGVSEPNAMVLGTADADGHPSVRTVLLRHYDEDGFVFFTHYTGRKGRELEANPWASACFPWLTLHRQVIVAGPVTRLDPAASDQYFASRPRGSQLASAASPQSEIIESLDVVRRAMDVLDRAHPEPKAVPRPKTWGGLRIAPVSVEFWQGNENRLHDRLRYRRAGAAWFVERLAP